MSHAQHFDVLRESVAQRVRQQPVQGVRRSARLISVEIRRSRRADHTR